MHPKVGRTLCFLGLGILVIAAGSSCGDDTPAGAPVDGGVDAGFAPDAGQVFTCGRGVCTAGQQYCQQTPTGACEARDGGCAPDEARCMVMMTSGCGPVTRACVELPPGCSDCACLFLEEPCGPGLVNFTCQDPVGRIDVSCPF